MNAFLKTLGVVMGSAACLSAAAAGNQDTGESRAQVRGELQAARDAGWQPPSGRATFRGALPVRSEKTRDEVRSEVIEARESGVRLPRGRAQPQRFTRVDSDRTREEVRQELLSALESGWRPSSGEASYWRQQSPGGF